MNITINSVRVALIGFSVSLIASASEIEADEPAREGGAPTESKSSTVGKEDVVPKRNAEWFLKNWQDNQSEKFKRLSDGIYAWTSSDGATIGKVEVKNGLPFNGIVCEDRRASDFRTLDLYVDGKATLLAGYYLRDGQWTVLFDKLPGEQDADAKRE